MWVMTQSGFYSIVEYEPSKDDSNFEPMKGDLLVRARVRGDLEALREFVPQLKIRRDDSADYRFRSVMTRDEWRACLAGEIQRIDYSNFKDRVSARQGSERSGIYHDVWAALKDLRK